MIPHMDKETLEQLQQAASTRFDELQQQVGDLEKESLRVQGKYFAYKEMLEAMVPLDHLDPATTIDVEPTLKKEDKKKGKKDGK